MKTYIISHNYNNTRKVTVEDDVEISCWGDDHSEGMIIKFNAPTGKYDNSTIAAFNNVSTFYLEGTDIQELDYERVESTKAEPKVKRNKKWSPIKPNA